MQLLQSLKSKMLDLARALQSYMHHHITVSFFSFLEVLPVINLHIYAIMGVFAYSEYQAMFTLPCFCKC